MGGGHTQLLSPKVNKRIIHLWIDMGWLVNNILSTDIMNDHDIITFFYLYQNTSIPAIPPFSACLNWRPRRWWWCGGYGFGDLDLVAPFENWASIQWDIYYHMIILIHYMKLYVLLHVSNLYKYQACWRTFQTKRHWTRWTSRSQQGNEVRWMQGMPFQHGRLHSNGSRSCRCCASETLPTMNDST